MHPLLLFSAGTYTHEQLGSIGGFSKAKVGHPRKQHSLLAEQAWDPALNHMQHGSMGSCSTHQNVYLLECSAGEQPSKHRAVMSVRVYNAKDGNLSCHVCSGKGSGPEQVLYDLADREELVKVYAAEACSLSKQQEVEV